MYKLLATDIDDTVLATDGTLPDANRDAIRRLHEEGIVVVFSSGRADVSIRTVASRIVDLADDEYLISFNGARVVTALTGTPLVELPMSPEMVAEVLAYTRSRNLTIQAYTGERFLVEKDGPRPRRYGEDTGMHYDVVPDLAVAAEAAGGSPKLLIIDEHEALAGHLPHLQALGRDGGWTVTFSKPHYLEVVRAGVNKGIALRRLAEHLGIGIEDTVAAGDSLNDREMIEAAGLGVAVANAREELKAAADTVTARSADEGAIAEIAERYFEVV